MASPVIDGRASSVTPVNTTLGSVTLTTANTQDIICVFVATQNTSNNSTNHVASVTATGLTFSKRVAVTAIEFGADGSNTGWNGLEFWTAQATNTLNAVAIHVTWSAAVDDGIIFASGFHGVGSLSSPFDPNGSLPANSTSNSSTRNTAFSAKTSSSNNSGTALWMMLDQDFGVTAIVPSGFTNVNSGSNAGGTLDVRLLVAYNTTLAAPTTNTSWQAESVSGWIVITDVLSATAASSQPYPWWFKGRMADLLAQ